MKKKLLNLSLILIFAMTILFVFSCDKAEYTVTFDSDGGTAVESQTVAPGGFVKEPDPPTKDGYKFVGWYSGADKWNFGLYAIGGNLTLKAKWSTDLTVAFDSDGGTAINSQTVKTGSLLTAPINPKRDGYEFLGWYYGEIKWDFATEEVTKNLTLRARWIKIHKVTFDTDGGSYIAIQSIRDGEYATLPTPPTKAGHIFKGWTVGGNEWHFDTSVSSDLTVKAIWAPLCTVSFDADGGNTLPMQYIEKGTTVSKPAAPTKTGYVFAYWYESTDITKSEWSFTEDTVERNITLRAKWLKIHTVSFNTNGGAAIAPIEVVDGGLITDVQTPTKPLYIFDKWIIDEVTAWNMSSDRVSTDITLTAVWKANYYTVVWNLNGGSGTLPTQLVELGQPIPEPQNPTKENYAFVAWLSGGEEWSFASDTVTELNTTLTLTASWADQYYTVTFNSDGGSPVPPQNVPKASGIISKPTDPEKQGFAFLGWYYNGNPWNFANSAPSDITLTAMWIEKFTISFDTDGGSAVAPLTIQKNQIIPEPSIPIKSGFKFDGWYLGDNEWDFNTPVTESITLKAKWVSQKDVSFDLAGGALNSSASVPSVKYDPDSLISNPGTPVKTGYVFDGWFNGGEAWDFSTDRVTETMTLTAKWRKLHTISFDLDGGAGTFQNQQIADGDKLAAPNGRPTKGNYGFVGWSLLGETTLWDFNTPITQDIVLVAQWTSNVYTITFDANGGSPTPEVQYVAYGSTILKPAADPQKTSEYRFNAWFDEDGNEWDFTKTPERDMTLKAHWYQLSTPEGPGVLGPWDETNNTWGPVDEF